MSPRPLRVVYFDAYSHQFGGSHQVLLLLATELARRGTSVEVLAADRGPLTERLAAAGIPWTKIDLPPSLSVFGHQTQGPRAVRAVLSLPSVWFRLARWLRSRADVVHVNDLRGILLLGPAARLARRPVIWHVHLQDDLPVVNRAAKLLASAIVVPTRTAVEGLPGVDADDVTVIPNCVPPDVLDEPPVPGHSKLIVTASRLTPQKGLDILFAALARVRCLDPEVQLHVFGAPQSGYEAHAAELRDQVARLDLDTAVTFSGQVDRPHRHWQSASIYVQSSRFEIQPVSILEAMASGLPVVATSVGGVPELVDDDVTGRLVPPEDPDALAAALEDLLVDPDAAHSYGQAGRRKALDTFSVERMADRALDLYRRLAG